jgi:hypothetical protein
MQASPMEAVATVIFALAVLHTFSTKFFERLAHAQPAHAGIWHLLGEVEVVFGFWALVLIVSMAALLGTEAATGYLDSRDFTEPMFVFAIMVVAGSRPILHCARLLVAAAARALPLRSEVAIYFCTLSLVPLLGSFITEPAAMTLAALTLRERYFGPRVSTRLSYGTLGVLFVNVSIGGVLTPFAAPPVLMVASTWNWDVAFMLTQFGWKAALAVLVNAAAAAWLFRHELGRLPSPGAMTNEKLPGVVIAMHLLFLTGIVLSAHHPAVFMGLLMFFMGFTTAYARYQDRLMLREGLLVAFFLAGLVVLGGLQQWWLKPLLLDMSADAVYWGAMGLTAITDNAALTYLGSLVPGLSPEFKYALVAGAVAGGGLTVIANAPNPAGVSILRERFEGGAISPLYLLLAALGPTAVAALAFLLL